MESNKDDLSSEITIRELYENEEEEEKNDYQKKYQKRPEVKARIKKKKQTEHLAKELRKLGTHDPHEMCKKLGQTLAHSRRNPDYFYRCSKCGVSYSDKEKIHFYQENKCPCCHLLLRTRKTTTQKRNISIENYGI